jgi:hypothetical protein
MPAMALLRHKSRSRVSFFLLGLFFAGVGLCVGCVVRGGRFICVSERRERLQVVFGKGGGARGMSWGLGSPGGCVL